MHRFVVALVSLALLSLADAAGAQQAGWRQITLAAANDSPPIVVSLYYPTRAPSQAVASGPFTLHVAAQAAAESTTRGLIVLSHGNGGSELAHSSLAEALARAGYLVAALRHPGDNWQDRSLMKDPTGAYFSERPRQVTRVIDALLSDPQWGPRVASDASGPRVGAVGHSAGAYTVLALGGGVPELTRIARHCSAEAESDPIFCRLSARAPAAAAAPQPRSTTSLADPRVRAVVALAPLGVVFTERSLAAVRVPVALYEAEGDRFLVPKYHAEWLAANLPKAQMHRVPKAWHFAFNDKPSAPIATDDGDLAADPAGFDRQAFLAQLGHELVDFFDRVFP